MINIGIQIIIYPLWALGWLAGFCCRPFIAGWAGGYFILEQKEKVALLNEIEQEL